MAFIEQGYEGKTSWWRWLLVSIIIISPFLYKSYAFIITFKEPFKQVTKDTNDVIMIIFSWYILFTLVLFFLVKFMHKRTITSLITPTSSIDWWRLVFGISLGGLFIILFFSVSYFQSPENYYWNFKLMPFLQLFLICFTLIPLGAVFKEVFFRGYLLQGISIALKSKWKALLIVSFLYMLCFGLNPVIKSVGFEILLLYFSSSILTGLIALFDDRLELAIGIRIANNIFKFLYITTLWAPIQSNAVLIHNTKPGILNLVYIPVFIFFPIFLYCLKEMYDWKNWKQKLFGKV